VPVRVLPERHLLLSELELVLLGSMGVRRRGHRGGHRNPLPAGLRLRTQEAAARHRPHVRHGMDGRKVQ